MLPDLTASVRRRRWQRVVVALEVAVVAAVVIGDLFVPTVVIVAIASASVGLRRAGFRSLGFHRVARPGLMVTQIFALSILWTVLVVGLFLPVLEHLTGMQQDVSSFEGLHGNPGALAVTLLVSWTLAAVGEEVAYRGYLLTRARALLPDTPIGAAIAVGLSSVLFGWAHTEQGLIGVVLAAVDGVLYCALRYRFDTVWAPVLAHGFLNTIGLVAVFAFGPVRGLW